MMASMDLSGGGATPRSGTSSGSHGNGAPRHSYGGAGARYATFSSPRSRPPPTSSSSLASSSSSTSSSSASSAGRVNTDLVVLEFLYKMAELVLQSRVNLQADTDSRRGTRRARFNLDIEEVQFVRDALQPWKDDVHLPLAIDILHEVDDRRVLLERWSVAYAPGGGGNRDVILQLKEVCKKISVLLRVVHCFMRQLPAHRIFQRAYPPVLSYDIHTGKSSSQSASAFEPGVATSRYSFVPIHTPFGFLKVSTIYRRDCEGLDVAPAPTTTIFQSNCIIQDYVQSPEVPSTLRKALEQDVDPTDMLAAALNQAQAPIQRNSEPNAMAAVPDFVQSNPERRRRSTPSSADPRNDDEVRHTPNAKTISQPMAIPMPQGKAVAAVVYDDELSAPTDVHTKGAPVTSHAHPHSYGDPERLRALTSNPNVTPAPYGYGNVAIESSNTPLPPQAHRWRASSHAGVSDGDGGGSSSSGTGVAHRMSTGSYPEHTLSPHPLATPPRHPGSLSILKSSRTLLTNSSTRKLSVGSATGSAEYGSSLENFSLDIGQTNGAPNQATSTASRRKDSFAGAFVTGSPDEQHRRGSPILLSAPHDILGRSASFRLRQVTPSNGNKGSLTSSTEGPGSWKNKTRTFSSDANDSSAMVWGVSPDSPDLFGLALVGSTRHRFLSSSDAGSVHGEGTGGSASQGGMDGEMFDMMLPFVVGDDDSVATTATTTSTATADSARAESAVAVGHFLHQLKHAPRLRIETKPDSTTAGSISNVLTKSTGISGTSGSSTDAAILYDDELAGFRSLRDELAHEA